MGIEDRVQFVTGGALALAVVAIVVIAACAGIALATTRRRRWVAAVALVAAVGLFGGGRVATAVPWFPQAPASGQVLSSTASDDSTWPGVLNVVAQLLRARNPVYLGAAGVTVVSI